MCKIQKRNALILSGLTIATCLAVAGTITQENLRLKQEALASLNIPVTIRSGYLKRFHVDVPWSHLSSRPVVVEIEDVFIIATPNSSGTSHADVVELVRATIKSKLQDIITWDAIRRTRDESTEEDAGYLAKLGASRAVLVSV